MGYREPVKPTDTEATPSRRSVITALAVGGAGAAVAGVGGASSAQAANGSPLILGASNTATRPTGLSVNSSGIGLTVANTGTAMFFTSTTGNGVAGRANSPNAYGFSAANVGAEGSGAALAASGINNAGILANTNNAFKDAVVGDNLGTNSKGVLASRTGDGVIGIADDIDFGGYGVWAIHPQGQGYPALVANGDTYLDGDLFVSGAKAFRIDHPVDPTTKWLQHAAVESPLLQTVYDGVTDLDAAGTAAVELPSYFEALNGEPRYQLTPLGAPMPDLHVSQKVQANRFGIAGGTPGGQVSWQVTGVRQDAYAKNNPLPVEVSKDDTDTGSTAASRTRREDREAKLRKLNTGR